MRNVNVNEQQNQQSCQTSVICSALSSDDWRRLAGHIDNGFFGSEKTFSAKRKNGYYYLNTNTCDDVSMFRVYCQIGVAGIDKIERLAILNKKGKTAGKKRWKYA